MERPEAGRWFALQLSRAGLSSHLGCLLGIPIPCGFGLVFKEAASPFVGEVEVCEYHFARVDRKTGRFPSRGFFTGHSFDKDSRVCSVYRVYLALEPGEFPAQYSDAVSFSDGDCARAVPSFQIVC